MPMLRGLVCCCAEKKMAYTFTFMFRLSFVHELLLNTVNVLARIFFFLFKNYSVEIHC